MKDAVETGVSKASQIIDAAVAEFQENGFAAASMDRISARAEVSKRTVYKHFQSKENLFHRIVKDLSGRFAEGLDVTYQPGLDIRQQLTDLAWAEGRLLMSVDVMAMAKIVISEVLRHPDMASRMQDKIDSKTAFVDFLADAAADGQLAIDDPDHAAEEFIALIKAGAFWPVIFGADIVSQPAMARNVENSVEMMICRYGK